MSVVRSYGLGPVLLIATFLASGPATVGAQQTSAPETLTTTLYAQNRYDSNLFRLADGVQPGGSGNRSVWTRTYGIGLRLDKTYGLQQVLIDGSFSRQQYGGYSNLDANSRVVNAVFRWRITPDISGNLIYSKSAVPNDFADVGFQTTSNIRKIELKRADFDWRSNGGLHPRISVFETVDNSERAVFQVENSRTTSAQIGLIYTFRTQNSLEAYGREARGNYSDQDAVSAGPVSAHFHEREAGIRVHGETRAVWSLDGNLGYLDREHDKFPVRNFSGVVGQLLYTQILTGKTRISINATRTFGSSQTLTNSYYTLDSLSIRPQWQPTGKLTVMPIFELQERQFRGPVVPVRQDLIQHTRLAALSVEWAVVQSWSVSGAAGQAKRMANDPSFQYVNRYALINVQYKH